MHGGGVLVEVVALAAVVDDVHEHAAGRGLALHGELERPAALEPGRRRAEVPGEEVGHEQAGVGQAVAVIEHVRVPGQVDDGALAVPAGDRAGGVAVSFGETELGRAEALRREHAQEPLGARFRLGDVVGAVEHQDLGLGQRQLAVADAEVGTAQVAPHRRHAGDREAGERGRVALDAALVVEAGLAGRDEDAAGRNPGVDRGGLGGGEAGDVRHDEGLVSVERVVRDEFVADEVERKAGLDEGAVGAAEGGRAVGGGAGAGAVQVGGARLVEADRRGGVEAGVVGLVRGVPVEQVGDLGEGLLVVLVEHTEQVEVERRAAAELLGEAQQVVGAGLGGEAPGEVDEVGRGRGDDLAAAVGPAPLRLLAGLVGPLGLRAVDGALDFEADEVAVAAVAGDGDLRVHLLDVAVAPGAELERGAVLELDVVGVGGVGEILLRRQRLAVHLAKAADAIVALADAEVRAGVVGVAIAEHVEEDAVDVVLPERLRDDLECVVLIPAAVDAGLVGAVVLERLALAVVHEPVGMRLVGDAGRLRHVEAADERQALGVGGLDRGAEGVVLHVGVDRVQRQPGRVEGEDAADVVEQDVGAEGAGLLREGLLIVERVGLAEVGLHHAVGALPPGGRGRRVRGGGGGFVRQHACGLP